MASVLLLVAEFCLVAEDVALTTFNWPFVIAFVAIVVAFTTVPAATGGSALSIKVSVVVVTVFAVVVVAVIVVWSCIVA